MAKSPFEKVRSQLERKKIFEDLLQLKETIICKGSDDSLFHFQPTALMGDGRLHGNLQAIEESPRSSTKVLGNFSVGPEKYFFNVEMEVGGPAKNQEASFVIHCDLFRLQRRSSLRLQILPSYGVYLAITEVGGKLGYSVAQIADVSTGGARIFFSLIDSPVPAASNSTNPGLATGDRFKAVLHNGPKKSIEVQGLVRHIQKSVYRDQIIEQFGIEFVELTPSVTNRLISMSMELQQKMAWDEY